MDFLYFAAVVLGPLMRVLYNFIGNYAVTMIVFTVLIKLISFPLAIHSQKSMAKMSVFQPLITELQTKYKNNQEKLQEEMMKLQQEHGYNPLSGCWPQLLNMIILFGIIGVVYYPVHYILGIPNDAITAACDALGLSGGNVIAMQTSLIQAIHNGATVSTDILSTAQVSSIQSFNTMFFGMDMCDIPGFNFVGIAIFPIISAITMFASQILTQRWNGSAAQMQGSMKAMMWVMNLMFVFYCFTAPVGFSLYYGVSNLCMIIQSFITYKMYSPEKFKAQFEAEMAAKKAAKKQKKVLVVEENGSAVKKELTAQQADRMRLELARQQDAEFYRDERTTPNTQEP